jgi:hypothetical protein
MKKITIKHLLFLFIAFASISCDKLEALIPDINLNVPLEFSIDIKATDPWELNTNFEVSGLNDSISKYTNLIKDYTIDSVNISLIDFIIDSSNRKYLSTSNTQLKSPDHIFFYLNSISNESILPTITLVYVPSERFNYLVTKTNSSVIQVVARGKSVNLNLPSANLNTIASMLKSSNKLSGYIHASTNIKPVKLKFRLNVYAKAKIR